MRSAFCLILLFSFLFCSCVVNAQDSVAMECDEIPFLWERPVPAVLTSSLLVAGSSTLFFEPSKKLNLYVRDNVQAWRQKQFGNSKIIVDNILQYLPLIAVEGLDLLGVPSRHTGWPMLQRVGSTAVVTFLTTQAIKYSIDEKRPDSYGLNSFPSGHTSFAFAGAELLRLEYGETSVWIPIAGYAVAATTGVMRIYNDRHWTGDVLAGAAIGMICADVSYWLNDKFDSFLAPRKKR